VTTLPPPPLREEDHNSPTWKRWFSLVKSTAATIIDSPTADNFASLDSNGNIQDSGYDQTSFLHIDGGTLTGDLQFTGDAIGLSYGSIYQTASFTVTMTNQNDWYELDAAVTNLVAGNLNNVTFPGDHYLQVTNAGMYLIHWSAVEQIDSVVGANQDVETGIMIGGAIQSPGQSRTTFVAISRDLPGGGAAILDLAAAAQISLGARNTISAGKIITVDRINMTVLQVGGT